MMSDALYRGRKKQRKNETRKLYLLTATLSIPFKIVPDSPTLPHPHSLLALINRKCGAQGLPVYPEMGPLVPRDDEEKPQATARITPAAPSSQPNPVPSI